MDTAGGGAAAPAGTLWRGTYQNPGPLEGTLWCHPHHNVLARHAGMWQVSHHNPGRATPGCGR